MLRRSGDAILVRNYPLDWKERGTVMRGRESDHPIDLYFQAYYALGRLAEKARARDGRAAMELARLAAQSTHDLNDIAARTPELFQPLARVRHAWPVIKSRRTGRKQLSAAENTLFGKIQLGVDSMIELDPATARWKFDDAGKISYWLLAHLHHIRERFKKMQLKVAPFSDDSSGDWWMAAKKVLLQSYPAPEEVQEFDVLVTAKTKRKSPGRRRAKILEVLESRFLSFARNPR